MITWTPRISRTDIHGNVSACNLEPANQGSKMIWKMLLEELIKAGVISES